MVHPFAFYSVKMKREKKKRGRNLNQVMADFFFFLLDILFFLMKIVIDSNSYLATTSVYLVLNF